VTVEHIVALASATFGIVGALCWLRSSQLEWSATRGKKAHFEGEHALEPYIRAVNYWSAIAAALTAVSIMLFAVADFLR
jgi:hypothetical protein